MFNISSSCTSQNSTAIISSTTNQSSHAASSAFPVTTPTIDRHNPIITKEKRSGITSKHGNTNHIVQQKPKQKEQNTPTSTTHRSKHIKLVTTRNNSKNASRKDDEKGRRSFSKTTEMIMSATVCKTSKAGVDYVTPESSRYLLGDNSTNYLDNSSETNKKTASHGTLEQVVMLRVSLHCRGCEKKLRKHLSTMSGVTSFNIDFPAKKVTVVGDVTPVQVLSSISKVKTAKIWSTTSSHANTKNPATTKK